MSDTDKKTYTVEEMREAFCEGALRQREHRISCGSWWSLTEREAEAARLYPSPKKLREVRVEGMAYRFRDGVLEYQDASGWYKSSMTPDEVRALHDLLDNPYEEEK